MLRKDAMKTSTMNLRVFTRIKPGKQCNSDQCGNEKADHPPQPSSSVTVIHDTLFLLSAKLTKF